MAKVKLTVVFERYVTNGDVSEGIEIKTYEGDNETSVLQRIVKVHSYRFEGQETMDAKELYENLMEVNGDGCDYIKGVYVGELVEYKPQ